MSNDVDAARKKFDKLTSGWPTPPPADNQPEEPTVDTPQEPQGHSEEGGPAAQEESLKLSDREEKIIRMLTQKIDFGELLFRDFVEVDVPLRKDLVLRFRSPGGGDPFEYATYISRVRKGAEKAEVDFTPADEYHYRIYWQLAKGLVAVNGEPFMANIPDDSKISPIDVKIQRLREKSKHVIEQFMWAQNIFDLALQRVCNGDEFGEALKNS